MLKNSFHIYNVANSKINLMNSNKIKFGERKRILYICIVEKYSITTTMRKLTITILITLTFLTTVYGQWNESNFIPATSLYEVEFPSPDAAYITGDMGLIYKSTDAGKTWNQIYDFGPFSSLSDPNFINVDTGFVSVNGEVYRTLDGGVSWTGIKANWSQSASITISRIKITEKKIYTTFVSNDTTYFLKSDDYGTNWITVFQNYEMNAQPYHFSMIDSLNGYFVNPNELEQVLKTTNGGLSFSDTLVVTNGKMVPQAKYDFTDLQNGYWYGSERSRSHPTRTWNTGTFYFPIDLDGFGVLPVLDLDFNTSKLYASSLYGKIFFSLNKGRSWTEQKTSVSGSITSIAFTNENQGIAVSGNKVIYTNNGGTVGIGKSSNLSSSINIYPNPASDFITIKANNIEILKLTITDINGKTLKSIFNPSAKYNITELHAGIYFLNIETRQGKLTKKVVIR